MAPIPITIITGFLGSGKTTLILNLLPQLPKTYKLALLKNEFGDLAVDSQLASSGAISGVKELLNGCICCNLVGQLSEALIQLRTEVGPDRILIETSGSAFPATLAMEVNRLSREHEEGDSFVLDGVVSVIDVENWKGYEDTSYTAKLQAKYTDLIVFNKWEDVGERRFDDCLDRLGDLELQFAWVKSKRGWVDQAVLMGVDGALISTERASAAVKIGDGDHDHAHAHDHHEEVEVLSVTLFEDDNKNNQTDVPSPDRTNNDENNIPSAPKTPSRTIDLPSFQSFLTSAPKDEIYRIKGLIAISSSSSSSSSNNNNNNNNPPPTNSTGESPSPSPTNHYILNWAFGRWTYTPLSTPPHQMSISSNSSSSNNNASNTSPTLRLTIILARGEATKWQRKLSHDRLLRLDRGGGAPSTATDNSSEDRSHGRLVVERVA